MALRLKSLAAPLFLLIALASLVPAASAQERRVPSSPSEVRLSYAPVVQRVAPAVVNVYAGRAVAASNPLFDDPIFRRFFGMPGAPGMPARRCRLSSGTDWCSRPTPSDCG